MKKALQQSLMPKLYQGTEDEIINQVALEQRRLSQQGANLNDAVKDISPYISPGRSNQHSGIKFQSSAAL